MKIVIVSAEVVPFSKTGGMGDVCGALADALAAAGHQVITVSPLYGTVDLHRHEVTSCPETIGIVAGSWRQDIGFAAVQRNGVTHFLVRHPMFGQRQGIYGDARGGFGDNHLRFSVLTRAGIEAARRVVIPGTGAPLGDDVIFHVHDWHTSLLPLYLDANWRPLGHFERSPVVLTLHNLAHQGLLAPDAFSDLELPPRFATPWGMEWHGMLGFLKAGLLHADALTTVSPNYAREIMTREGGFGLDGLLRQRKTELIGILNGVDTDVWNPATDPHLPARFDASDLSGKAVCKAELQASLGLPVTPNVPLVASIGRLDPQKGVALLLESLPWLAAQDAQVVVLGSAGAAHKGFEDELRQAERRFPRHVRAWIGFSEPLAHRIEAAADLFAMPSAFEPCGLNQMYSMRYGTPPIVHATGGLVDTVTPFDPQRNQGTGWWFRNFEGYAFREALHHALVTWRHHRDAFRGIQQRGMRADWSWQATIPKYEALYAAVAHRRGLKIS